MFLEKAKAALARKQKMYNAKAAFFVHIGHCGWYVVPYVVRGTKTVALVLVIMSDVR